LATVIKHLLRYETHLSDLQEADRLQ